MIAGAVTVPLAELAEIRQSVRWAEHRTEWPDDWDTGGCGIVSEVVERRYGWRRHGGCYVPAPTERHYGQHVDHYWNVLPDGRILDVTADQFDGVRVPRVVNGDDPRYASTCRGDESCNGGRGPA